VSCRRQQVLQKDRIRGKDLGFFFLKIELAGGCLFKSKIIESLFLHMWQL